MQPVSSSRPRWLRRCALASAAVFTWSLMLATPMQALTHQSLHRGVPGYRPLSSKEMCAIIGRDTDGEHNGTTMPRAGSPYPWEGASSSVDAQSSINLANGNKNTILPLVGWKTRGDMLFHLTLAHNSQSTRNAELGQKWTHSFNIYGTTDGSGNITIHWGDDRPDTYMVSGSLYSAPTGIFDALVKNVDGTYTLTKTSQIKYHFTSGLQCDRINDENGNQITLNYTSGRLTTVVDPTGRTITLGYDASNRINSITDPLSRQWTFAYDSSNNLQTVTLPVLNSTYYTWVYGYDANHNINDIKNPRGYHNTFSYNSTNNSLAWSKDAYLNQTTYSYTSSTSTITDPNGHQVTSTYTGDFLTQSKDALTYHADYLYDSNYNTKQITDSRGKVWQYTYDSRGNLLTAKDPLLNQTIYTYNSHNKLQTVTIPTGEQTVYGYDAYDNLTSAVIKDNTGTTQSTVTYTANSYGQTTDYYDANNHHSQYGYDGNGNLNSHTTPLGNVTQWTFDALGFALTRTDALLRQTTYTPDAWERLTKTTYPDISKNHTYTYDADNDLTAFTDVTGSSTLSYDNADRLLSETKGGSTVVSHTYDATGKLGLLSTTTDANSRVITFAYTARNQLYQVSDTAGTATYAYDANGNETGITNQNGTTVTETYDTASQVIGVVNKNSGGTTLSSFSYVPDADNRRHTVTEADGSMVTYGYDWGGRLTSEVRTGTNPYSKSYVLDAVGNRTSQTVGTASTTFTYDIDDELKTATSTTGGLNNSYGYNANGEQTTRTLGGTLYNLSFDYEGQSFRITQGASYTGVYNTDALGRRASRSNSVTPTTTFFYDGGLPLVEKQGSTTTATYTYGNALLRKDSEFPLFDGQGSERTVTNVSQSVQGSISYDAFGLPNATSGSSTSAYMFGATSGYRSDGDSGLILAGCRYYDPQVDRFVTRDTDLGEQPYVYCDGDPVNYTDPSGHDKDGDPEGGSPKAHRPGHPFDPDNPPPGYHFDPVPGGNQLAPGPPPPKPPKNPPFDPPGLPSTPQPKGRFPFPGGGYGEIGGDPFKGIIGGRVVSPVFGGNPGFWLGIGGNNKGAVGGGGGFRWIF